MTIDSWTIWIPGEPVARAEKVAKIGGFGRIIDQSRVRDYKAYARTLIAQSAPNELMDGPLMLVIEAYVTRPKSVPKSRIYPTSKPDLSNILKCVEDCLSKIVIVDDARFVTQINNKSYADGLNPPGVRIAVECVHWPILAHIDAKTCIESSGVEMAQETAI